jgi:hypothetical protein
VVHFCIYSPIWATGREIRVVPALCHQMAPLSHQRDREISSRGGHLCFIIFSSVLEDGHETSQLRFFFISQDGFWEPGETPPPGLFSLLIALLYLIASAYVLLEQISFFWDRMPRHIVCSLRCLVTILLRPTACIIFLYSIWTAFVDVYGFNSRIKDISRHF